MSDLTLPIIGDPASSIDMQLNVSPAYTKYPNRRTLELDVNGRDWHSAVTITLGELLGCGAMPTLKSSFEEAFQWFTLQPHLARYTNKYNELTGQELTVAEVQEALANQCYDMFVDNFYTLEINADTPAEWLHLLRGVLRRGVSHVIPIFASIDPNESGWRDYQTRNLRSEYPASLMKGDEDYGDNANDIQYSEEYSRMNLAWWQWLVELYQRIGDPISSIVDMMEILFIRIMKIEGVSTWDTKPGAGLGYNW